MEEQPKGSEKSTEAATEGTEDTAGPGLVIGSVMTAMALGGCLVFGIMWHMRLPGDHGVVG